MAGDIEKALAYHLKNYSPLASLVNSRIFPVRYPQNGGVPYVTYQRVSTRYLTPHGEYSMLPWVRMQVDSFAEDYETVKKIAAQVKNALDGFRGEMGSGTDTVLVFSCVPGGASDDFSDDPALCILHQDFQIMFE